MSSWSTHWRSRLKTLLAGESGASATEYAILLAMLVLGSMGVIQSIGESFRGIYLAIAGKVPSA